MKNDKRKENRKKKSVTAVTQNSETNSVEVCHEESLSETTKNDNIDPNKYLKVISKRLSTGVPDIVTVGDDAVDDEENDADVDLQYQMTISEAFAEDDVVAEFM